MPPTVVAAAAPTPLANLQRLNTLAVAEAADGDRLPSVGEMVRSDSNRVYSLKDTLGEGGTLFLMNTKSCLYAISCQLQVMAQFLKHTTSQIGMFFINLC